ncbi:thermonuclease family protein [Okeania sp. SIO2B3]|uniref:thermonuclease family protein n=1 Tax=Okeania sp. SIO2B3 TaxID=2607784 RepID=UPI0013C29E61|nr:thermonuclease family protein [Okeania sp. SIO2B3]NET44768.1 hypothetical protein [Okeania sp. SIO2B3]
MMIFSLVGCNRSSKTITAFRDSGIPETEYWGIESIQSGDRLTIKKGFRQRTLQLCGVTDLTSEAKSYLEEQVEQSPETVPTIFAGKDKEGVWYGDVWVGMGDDEESSSGLLLFNGLAKLSQDYYTCPNADALKLAEDLAREQKVGVWDGN